MRISDAKVGDVLMDSEGDVWLRRIGHAVVIVLNEHKCGDEWSLDDADSFGPFTRLVPEKEGDDAK